MHCVCHCVLAVLIKQKDPFYDFAVGDKWEEGTCKNENNVSMCVCNPRPSPDESTTFDQSVFLSHLRHLELCGRHNVRIQNGHLQASVAKCAGKSVGECRERGPRWDGLAARSSCPLFEGRLEGAIHHCPPPSALVRVILACPPKTGDPNFRPPATPIDLCGCSRLGET